MDFRTIVEIGKADFEIPPCEAMLFVGSCFADRLGKRFQEEKFRAVVNPFGVMYNPASILHTVERWSAHIRCSHEGQPDEVGLEEENEKTSQTVTGVPHVAVFTLGTNHVYILKETGEIVDNCRKRPQNWFEEKALTIEQCEEYLSKAVERLKEDYAGIKVIVTVSPIRYAKYGYHRSALSKAVLLLAAEKLQQSYPDTVSYFPAYEILNDELRDYRFYDSDMLHPSDQTVDYMWERFSDCYFGKKTLEFLADWKPVKLALNHRPFHPESKAYQDFLHKTRLKVNALSKKYPNFALDCKTFE
ncbi:MAG: GSCFA domain-containing protein [Prevotella sp.]|jgi:hypothetical protein|nr:GSCFA domain-containing protein [Prevotella sp.]MCH3994451.1 GSCFA domain-containing protein [Prevotella sp.]MCI1246903.1 GSCFA domain-containing protein [Prevotella sp.]